MRSWQDTIESALAELDEFLRASTWWGRENEIVNLFTHRFLAGRVSEIGPLRSLRQVGIEVAVPQVTGSVKRFVRKDLVIWPEEDMTVWTPGAIPAVIIEWKRESVGRCDPDIAWLRLFCKTFPGTIGYAACAKVTRDRGCWFRRVRSRQSATDAAI